MRDSWRALPSVKFGGTALFLLLTTTGCKPLSAAFSDLASTPDPKPSSLAPPPDSPTSINLDTHGPVISGLIVSNITTGGSKISWTTDEPATTVLQYGLSTMYGVTASGSSAFTPDHSVTLAGLTPGTTYYYRVSGADPATNSTSSVGSFATQAPTPTSTPPPADTTPPTGTISINAGATHTKSLSVTLTLTASDPSGVAQMSFSNDGTSFSTAETYVTPKSWTIPAGDGSKTVWAKFKDAAGNWSSATISDSIVLDTAGPTFSNFSVASTSTGATISWTTNEAATTNGAYGLTETYGTPFAGNSALTTAHSVNLTSLTASTKYYYQVKGTDQAGNPSTSMGQTFTTASTSPSPSVSYETEFDFSAFESPVSDRGAWQHKLTFWTHVEVKNGAAYGLQGARQYPGPDLYNDSYAYLAANFSPDQRVTVVIRKQQPFDYSCTHEVEMLLRFDDSNGVSPHGYECIIGHGYTEIVSWEGMGTTIDNFFYLVGPGGNDSFPSNGDVYRAEIVGDTIRIFKGSTMLIFAIDTRANGHAKWSNGHPGMGFFRGHSGCGSLGDYGLESFKAESLSP